MKRSTMKEIAAGVILSVALLMSAAAANATQIFSQGFETDAAGWYSPTRVASGTNGISSASGNWHAISSGNDYTRFGGYNFGAGGGVPTTFQAFTTSQDIYLNLNGGWANDTRFDWDVAVNKSDGTFGQDFVFNGGFYNDSDFTGTGNRFVVSASNNATRSSSYPKNPGRDPFAITTSGWYRFQDRFYNNGGILNVDLSILDLNGTVLNSWTLPGASSIFTNGIASVGGNRYGWFATNEFKALAIDNTTLTTASVPEPETLSLLALGLLVGATLISAKPK